MTDDAIQQQIRLLMDGDPERREAAVRALLEIGQPAVVPLCHALESGALRSRDLEAALEAARGALEAVKGGGAQREAPDPPEVAAWRGRVDDPHFQVRKAAAEGLGLTGHPQALRYLYALLQDFHPEVRQTAAEALGRVRDPDALPALMQALRDPDARVPWAAVWAMGEIGERATPFLTAALQNNHDRVRRDAIRHLARVAGSAAVPAISRALRDEDDRVRTTAALALGLLRDAASVPALCEAVDDQHPEVAWAALHALSVLGEPAVPHLCRMLEGPDGTASQRAADALAAMAGENPCPALRRAVPILRRLLGRLLMDPVARASYQAALATIEAATAAAVLPVPGAAPCFDPAGLPRPGALENP